MPLVKSNLVRDFSKFMDPDSAGFEGSPENAAEFADKFSKAINDYVASIVPPTNPATLPAATTALKTALLVVGPPDQGGQLFPVVITAAMLTFAGVVGAGMATVTPGTVPTPPPDPLGVSILASVTPAGLAGQPASVCVEALATTIDGWFRTGTASGAPWS
jgi:hypothetical protein